MDEALYLSDCYLKEFDATVESVKDGKFVVLDQTAFYPNAGGQPWDELAAVIALEQVVEHQRVLHMKRKPRDPVRVERRGRRREADRHLPLRRGVCKTNHHE